MTTQRSDARRSQSGGEIDVTKYNTAWLRAWSEKDTPRLLQFYHPDVVYKDNQTAAGIKGHAALKAYLDGLFGATPPMRYEPDEVWAIEGGYCGRWICTIDLPDGKQSWLRGFDLVLVEGDRITLNEVYTHTLAEKPYTTAPSGARPGRLASCRGSQTGRPLSLRWPASWSDGTGRSLPVAAATTHWERSS